LEVGEALLKRFVAEIASKFNSRLIDWREKVQNPIKEMGSGWLGFMQQPGMIPTTG
jgi:hypothetical protein